MFITLMGIALMVIGIIIVWICVKVPKIKKIGIYFGAIFLVFGFAWTTFVFEIIGLQRTKEDSEIANNQKEYVMLCANVRLLEANPDDEAKDTIIENVNDWNEKVDNGRKYLKDPWTSWLYNKNIVDSMEYIEIPEDLIK